ncbi:MAG: GNAT family N-acetyltransferase, partial [Myxococcales bacterium]|nr:GNAT family N-acetyltransferase [Myxococcales bacterium]
MTAHRRARDGGLDADLELRTPAPTERDALLAWLDDGLRDGRKGRLAAEYPTLLDPERGARHRIACVGDAFAAHAVSRTITLRVAQRSVRLGMIGLVYTDPRFRRRGLASACIEACVADLAAEGAAAALLWSDRHAFYRRLGFVPAGREILVRVDARVCDAAASRLAGACGVESVGAPQP